MILWCIQDLYDAGICDAGRVDCEDYMLCTGLKTTSWLTAVEGLFGGVAGTLWGMGYVKKGCEAEAANALSLFILKTAERYECWSVDNKSLWKKLEQLYRGHTFNLLPLRESLRKTTVAEELRPQTRAVAMLYYIATNTHMPLNIRAVQVSEQAMLAATYSEGHAVPSTEAYKAEYQRQYDQLKGILEGE